MSNYSILKGHINSAIYQNDTQDISGTDMNSILKEIVESFGAGYLYMGVATPSTAPGTPDQNVFYIAGTEGTYTNFGGITVANEVAVLKYNGAWSKQNTGIKFVSVSQKTGHTDITIGGTTTPVASVTDYEKSIQGTEKIDNTTTIANEYKRIYFPIKSGQIYNFKKVSGSSVQIKCINADDTLTDVKFSLYDEVVFTSDNDYIGYQTAGPVTIRVTSTSINDKIAAVSSVANAAKTTADSALPIAEKAEDYAEQLNDALNIVTITFNGNTKQEVNLKAGNTYKLQILDHLAAYMDFYYQVDDESSEVKIDTVTSSEPYVNFTPTVDTKYIRQTQADANWSVKPLTTELTKINDTIDNKTSQKIDVGYDNILDKSSIVNGSTYNSAGVRISNPAWNDLAGTILLPWRNQQYITVNKVGAVGGSYIVQFDIDGNFISGSAETNISGEHTFQRYSEEAYFIGISLYDANYALLDRPIRANYGQSLTEDRLQPNPIRKYINSEKKEVVELYAYGDASSSILDDATHFYGWQNGKCAWQRAIDAADGITRTIIYCKGEVFVNNANQFTQQEDTLYNVVFIPSTKSNIELVGEGADKTSLVVEMADDFANYGTYQPMGIYGNNSLVKGMSIYGKNCRYCIHIDATARNIGDADNYNIRIEDVLCRHYNNAGGSFKLAFAACASDGMTITAERCTFIQENDDTPPMSTHDNVDYSKGGILKFKECKFMNTTRAVELAVFQMLGSGAENVIIYDNCDFTHCQPIMLCENNNATSQDISKFVANNHFTIKGVSQTPIAYQTRSTSRSRVLRITSKTAGSSSSVRFDKTSSAFDILIKGNYITGYTELTGIVHADGYQYRDGADVVSGFAMGELALDVDTNASIQKRLGDCSSSNKSLVVSVDGTDYTITFNQNYTSYSDADMLAVFTAVLGDVANVELYNWGADYFPELQPSMTWGKNTSEEAILVGMGVMVRGGAVTKATSDDKVMGIALDNILPNCQGRIVRKAILSIYEDARHHICLETYPTRGTSDFYSYRGFFGIGSTPGVFVSKQAKAPLFGFDYGGWDNYLTIDL